MRSGLANQNGWQRALIGEHRCGNSLGDGRLAELAHGGSDVVGWQSFALSDRLPRVIITNERYALPEPRPSSVARKRGSGAKLVYDMLRDEILDLRLAPGSPLDEVQLADRFAMSRTPIREALVRLAGEGLVATLPNRTSVVSSIDLLSLSAFFDAMTLMYRVTTRLAAANRREGDLARVRQHQAAFAEAVGAGDALAMIAANRDFHAAIAEAGANPYFAALCCKLLDEGRRLLRLYYRSFDDRLPQEQVDEHEMMIAAVERGDVEAADRLAAIHAEGIVRQIRRLLVGEKRIEIAL